MGRSLSLSGSSLALNNLRGIVILIVLAFHSGLAYVEYGPPAASSSPPHEWTVFSIKDWHRFIGFDIFCAWQDAYLISLMFFLSGLFVWPSLARKEAWGFLRDRILRLGLPYTFGIIFLTPLATYPAYRLTAADPSVAAYVRMLLALPFWPNGQLWFLWQLLALNILAAIVYWLAPGAIKSLGRWSAEFGAQPCKYFAALVVASTIAYVPLALAVTPWAWNSSGILSIQFCRPLNYAVYFFAGVGIGAAGLDHGLLTVNGALARRWALWLTTALVSLFLWIGLTGLTIDDRAPLAAEIAADLSFVLTCAAGCFFFLAASLRFATRSSPMLDNLAVNAYGLYLVHYVFVVWLQYALIDVEIFAGFKFAVVFSGTLFFSAITIFVLQRHPFGAQLIGSTPRVVAGWNNKDDQPLAVDP